MRKPLLYSLSLTLLGAFTIARAENPAPASPAPAGGPNHAQVADKTALDSRKMDGTVRAPDGIAKARNEVLYLKDGKVTRVNYELKLSEGMVARPNGEVVLTNGQTITLKEGDMVTLDGKLTKAPTTLGSTAIGNGDTVRPDQGPKTEFGNTAARPAK